MPEFAPQVNFGKTDLKISPIIIGCQLWSEWFSNDKQRLFNLLKYCYDRGIRTFDTTDIYPGEGTSERLVGEFLRTYEIDRNTVVILSTARSPADDDIPITDDDLEMINHKGHFRKHIVSSVKGSVERLGTHIDVLQLDRWDIWDELDKDPPMGEIMRALNHVVKHGHVRYIGASSLLATEFAELQFVAEKHGWAKFISSQSRYNLLYREDERELFPFARRKKIALISSTPLSCSFTSRPIEIEHHEREIVSRVEEVAKDNHVTMDTLEIAWVLSKKCYARCGFSNEQRVDQALKALAIRLTGAEIYYLEELYKPRNLIY